MKNKKQNGSFYTPEIIATFLVNYLSKKLIKKNEITVLEPSAGDGIFIKSIFNHKSLFNKIKKIIAVEKNQKELNRIKFSKNYYEGIHSDFLEFQKNNHTTFNLVIGNPPYIKRNLLTKKQINLCTSIHQQAKLSANRPYNIWSSFLVRSIYFLEPDGILAFVLPSEFLQVKFAKELRDLVLKQFQRVEIFTFSELLFKECKGQDTIILIGEKTSDQKGVFYTNVNKISDLAQDAFSLSKNIKIKETKWTHHHLTPCEIDLLFRLSKKIKSVNNYCKSKAGIVTAANDYFIVDSKTIENYSLINSVKPIIQKGVFVNGSVLFTQSDFNKLVTNLKPAFLLDFKHSANLLKNHNIKSYLKMGVEKEINLRYKTSIRPNWYEVPNIGSPPSAFFFKRCNEYPKLIRNDANVLATDSAYLITMLDNYSINNLIFSFYNSLTLSFAELNGRYYGGGVLELTPNEFKSLPVPYVKISNSGFKNYVKEFASKNSIKDICRKYDIITLKSIDKDLTESDIDKIFLIREKLYLHRIKTN